MIFEGYGSAAENSAKSKAVEDLGIDVRWFKGGKKFTTNLPSLMQKLPSADSSRDLQLVARLKI